MTFAYSNCSSLWQAWWPNCEYTGLRIERSGFEPWSKHCVVFLAKIRYSRGASLHPGVLLILVSFGFIITSSAFGILSKPEWCPGAITPFKEEEDWIRGWIEAHMVSWEG